MKDSDGSFIARASRSRQIVSSHARRRIVGTREWIQDTGHVLVQIHRCKQNQLRVSIAKLDYWVGRLEELLELCEYPAPHARQQICCWVGSSIPELKGLCAWLTQHRGVVVAREVDLPESRVAFQVELARQRKARDYRQLERMNLRSVKKH